MTYIFISVQLYKPPIVYKKLYELRTYNTRFAVAGYWLQAKVNAFSCYLFLKKNKITESPLLIGRHFQFALF